MRTQVLMAAVGLALTGFGAGYPADLIYYSKLDSAADITNPTVGPAGTVNGATFQAGRVGNALFCPAKANVASFPFSEGLGSKGCIEFSAKILNTSDGINVSMDPSLLLIQAASDKSRLCEIHLGSNNGNGKGGVCFGPPYGWGTSTYNESMTYSDVLGASDPKGWHSYRLVWNKDGLTANGDGVALYIDDVLRGSSGSEATSFIAKLQQAMVVVLDEEWNNSPFLIDELKVWKTDTPSEDPAPVELPVVSEVTAKQHYPWCGKVDIGYTVAGSTDGLLVKISVKDNDNNVTYEAKTFDVKPTAAAGVHTVVWDATKDGVNKVSKNMVATVSLIVPAE